MRDKIDSHRTSYGMGLCTPVPNLRSFEQMLCELMVQEYLIGVEGQDRLRSYLYYESGLVDKDCLFMFIIFHVK